MFQSPSGDEQDRVVLPVVIGTGFIVDRHEPSFAGSKAPTVKPLGAGMCRVGARPLQSVGGLFETLIGNAAVCFWSGPADLPHHVFRSEVMPVGPAGSRDL